MEKYMDLFNCQKKKCQTINFDFNIVWYEIDKQILILEKLEFRKIKETQFLHRNFIFRQKT